MGQVFLGGERVVKENLVLEVYSLKEKSCSEGTKITLEDVEAVDGLDIRSLDTI